MKSDSAKKLFFLLFALIMVILSSPWLWVVVRNRPRLPFSQTGLFQIRTPARLDEINTFQGEINKTGLGVWGKMTVNKFTWMGKEILARALESFDTHYLFFEGDLDLSKSTRSAGPMFLLLLPLVIWSFWDLSLKKRAGVLMLLVFLSFSGALADQHYETFIRLPLIIAISALSANGLVKLLFCQRQWKWKALYFLLLLFEFSRFIHDFYLHYPGRLRG